MEFTMTVDSDSDEQGLRPKKPNHDQEVNEFDPDFRFELVGDLYADLLHSDLERTPDTVNKMSKVGTISTCWKPSFMSFMHIQNPIPIEEVIARRKLKHASAKRKRVDEYESESGTSDCSTERSTTDCEVPDEFKGEGASLEVADKDEASMDDSDSQQDSPSEDDDSLSVESETETQAEKDRKAVFFDLETRQDSHSSFLTMNLSRPLQRALTSLGFVSPTPIQASTIPVALLGKDVVGNAVTGSGKTAAFIIPILERLLYREKGNNATATRCLILVPTRELAVQCFEVGSKLAAYTDIRFCLAAGELNNAYFCFIAYIEYRRSFTQVTRSGSAYAA